MLSEPDIPCPPQTNKRSLAQTAVAAYLAEGGLAVFMALHGLFGSGALRQYVCEASALTMANWNCPVPSYAAVPTEMAFWGLKKLGTCAVATKWKHRPNAPRARKDRLANLTNLGRNAVFCRCPDGQFANIGRTLPRRLRYV